ncbi:hypothetical protein RF11_00410 [Thelohanellus kitauei]|uniref:Uncharacterized protein n=1 Tax=Thelohanellus kitauei TaxID=669202 RepID=A0A0C2MBN6_THEKT|nr:hypothetical protein RF11_00410 [Thelohanellus kitauei]
MSFYLLLLVLNIQKAFQTKALQTTGPPAKEYLGSHIPFNFTDGPTLYKIVVWFKIDVRVEKGESKVFNDLELKNVEFKGDDWIFMMMWPANMRTLTIKCHTVDTEEELTMSHCNISLWTKYPNETKTFSTGHKWRINKRTRYEFENMTIKVYLDQDQDLRFDFLLTNISFQTQCYNQIISIKNPKPVEYITDSTSTNWVDFSLHSAKTSIVSDISCPALKRGMIFPKRSMYRSRQVSENKLFQLILCCLLGLGVFIVTKKLNIDTKIKEFTNSNIRRIRQTRGYY